MSIKTIAFLLCLSVFLLTACDDKRVYEKNIDLDDGFWLTNNRITFDFTVQDYRRDYNIYYLVRNSLDFPFSRIFVEYTIRNEKGNNLHTQLEYSYLFDQKTGKPYGSNGLGSVFSHQFPLLTHYRFKQPGRYTVQLEQFNRVDSLQGVFSIGLRVEYAN